MSLHEVYRLDTVSDSWEKYITFCVNKTFAKKKNCLLLCKEDCRNVCTLLWMHRFWMAKINGLTSSQCKAKYIQSLWWVEICGANALFMSFKRARFVGIDNVRTSFTEWICFAQILSSTLDVLRAPSFRMASQNAAHILGNMLRWRLNGEGESTWPRNVSLGKSLIKLFCHWNSKRDWLLGFTCSTTILIIRIFCMASERNPVAHRKRHALPNPPFNWKRFLKWLTATKQWQQQWQSADIWVNVKSIDMSFDRSKSAQHNNNDNKNIFKINKKNRTEQKRERESSKYNEKIFIMLCCCVLLATQES